MAKPAVAVGLRKGRLFIVPQLSAGPGTYIDKTPVREVRDNDAASVGRAVLDALDDFAEIDIMPNLLEFESPVIAAAGVKNYSEYKRGLKDCLVVTEDDRLRVMWAGPHTYLPRAASPLDIGKAVLTALYSSPGQHESRERRAGAESE